MEEVHGHRWVDGNWEDQTRGNLEDQTRGDGGADQIHDARDSENTDNPWISEKAGGVGIFSGNWGGHWGETDLNDHMLFDVKSCPAHILTIQEAEEQLLTHLRQPAEPGIPKERAQETAAAASTHGDGATGGHVQWSRRPCGQFWLG